MDRARDCVLSFCVLSLCVLAGDERVSIAGPRADKVWVTMPCIGVVDVVACKRSSGSEETGSIIHSSRHDCSRMLSFVLESFQVRVKGGHPVSSR